MSIIQLGSGFYRAVNGSRFMVSFLKPIILWLATLLTVLAAANTHAGILLYSFDSFNRANYPPIVGPPDSPPVDLQSIARRMFGVSLEDSGTIEVNTLSKNIRLHGGVNPYGVLTTDPRFLRVDLETDVLTLAEGSRLFVVNASEETIDAPRSLVYLGPNSGIALGTGGRNTDTDRDSIPDAKDNCSLVANTAQSNYDNDDLGDDCDPDDDNDGMSDSYEDDNGLDSKNENDAGGDLDNDLLTNLEEANAGTEADNPDTDSDGLKDGLDDDPLNPTNFCSSLISDDVEFKDAYISSGQVVTCGAAGSVTVKSTVVIEAGGKAKILSPDIIFDAGFNVPGGAILELISVNPEPIP